MMKLSASAKSHRLEFIGVSASAGFASGRVWVIHDLPLTGFRSTGDVKLEVKRLKDAIGIAHIEVASLLKNISGRAAHVIAFQLEVLDDETFYRAAVEEMKNGQSSFDAWANVLRAEIAGYQNSNDTVFQAKVFDLQDIQARIARILCEQAPIVIPAGSIVIAENLSPSTFIAHQWAGGGIALTKGSVASHLAILARQFGVPMLTNLLPLSVGDEDGKVALLKIGDQEGKLIVSPAQSDFENTDSGSKITKKTKRLWPNGHAEKPIKLMINLSQLRELKDLSAEDFDGIGLVRTEFLFAGQNQNPLLADEEKQFHAYCEILTWAKGKPVYIRTIDAGGDKAISMKNIDADVSNLRGLKLSLFLPDLFRIQIRALLRAAAIGPLHVILPMVESSADFDEALNLFADEANKLSRSKIANAMPSIGMMVEVPSVALSIKQFGKAGHFAIGTNDLIELALGQPRDAAITRPSVNNPVVLKLIRHTVAAGEEMQKPVHVCGDAASNVDDIHHLLAAGVTSFSISPPSFPLVLNALNKTEIGRA